MLYQHKQTQTFHRHRQTTKHKTQSGVVLVVALFIVALIAGMSFVMMSRIARDTSRTTLMLRQSFAAYYAQGAQLWAKDQLRTNWEQQKANRVIDQMPSTMPTVDVAGYKIESTIYDMQARININNASNQEGQEQLLRLINVVAPKFPETEARNLVKAIADWITPGGGQQADLNEYYLKLSPPYRPAHRPMVSISELRLVKGMTPALYDAISPFVTALPNATMVNPQTAAPEVLATLSQTMTLETGKALAILRKTTPIISTQVFANLDVAKTHQVQADKLTVASSYFLLKTDVSIEKQHLVLYTLLERQVSSGKAAVNIIWQSKGVW